MEIVRVVWTLIGIGKSIIIDKSQLGSPGMYIIEINTGFNVYYSKFIVQ